MTRVTAPCGCGLIADHARGDRLSTCIGGGITATNGMSVSQRIVCPGGVKYLLTAERVEWVRYTTRRLP